MCRSERRSSLSAYEGGCATLAMNKYVRLHSPHRLTSLEDSFWTCNFTANTTKITIHDATRTSYQEPLCGFIGRVCGDVSLSLLCFWGNSDSEYIYDDIKGWIWSKSSAAAIHLSGVWIQSGNKCLDLLQSKRRLIQSSSKYVHALRGLELSVLMESVGHSSTLHNRSCAATAVGLHLHSSDPGRNCCGRSDKGHHPRK